jgi:FixJ family two-component response regulator
MIGSSAFRRLYLPDEWWNMEMSDAPLIAIVDDDVMVCEATTDLVEAFGFNARTFTSADQLLNSDCLPGTSCLIADVQMPGMNGLQLHRKLIASGHRIPVIFISAFPDQRVRERALSAGALCYLSKPFDGEILRSCIRSALGFEKGHANA